MFSDELMMVLTALAVLGTIWYGHRKQDFVVGLWWSMSIAWMCIFYATLVFDLLPNERELARVSFFRPGLASLIGGIIVFSFNGKLNRAIEKVSRWKSH